ncbi:alpha-crystallin A chain isoform X2 [Pteropus medius]|uniref:alpha-crystallin A chain isoform X2 n=1 Tax=Pteropus vampyrus TaxID=132908 RepID=UPI00196B2741|nr:alpha-crystallin A chain isoform X2 [Pteropus giganteus]
MDIAIQHPWFKRALGPFYPSRLFDQFFGEGLFEYDLLPFLSSTISPYYRQSLFRTVLDSGISEVRRRVLHSSAPRASGEGSGREPPGPDAVFSSHQLMTHMWFVMHQPHPGSPKSNPTKASSMADASCVSSGCPASPPAGSLGGGVLPEIPRGGPPT